MFETPRGFKTSGIYGGGEASETQLFVEVDLI